jgi:hypothetical protein
LFCTLVAAGLLLWSAGRGFDVLLGDGDSNLPAAAVAFAGLTVSVIIVGGANWQVWGSPAGTVAASLGLWAVWLVSAARLVLREKSVRLVSVLDFVAAALLVVIALSVQWVLPFS